MHCGNLRISVRGDTAQMGKPGSIGCIRMRNADVVELFDLTQVGTAVNISAG